MGSSPPNNPDEGTYVKKGKVRVKIIPVRKSARVAGQIAARIARVSPRALSPSDPAPSPSLPSAKGDRAAETVGI